MQAHQNPSTAPTVPASNPTFVVEQASPIGPLTIALHDGALRALWMGQTGVSFDRMLVRDGRPVQHVALGDLDARDAELARALRAYFDGDVAAIDDVPVRTNGTGFAQRVWDALRTIPVGETWSYAQLARTVGTPGASRAVGRANATNPVAIVVPCHRVIRSDGTLGGYGGGLDRKRWLLDHERRHVPAAAGVLAL